MKYYISPKLETTYISSTDILTTSDMIERDISFNSIWGSTIVSMEE